MDRNKATVHEWSQVKGSPSVPPLQLAPLQRSVKLSVALQHWKWRKLKAQHSLYNGGITHSSTWFSSLWSQHSGMWFSTFLSPLQLWVRPTAAQSSTFQQGSPTASELLAACFSNSELCVPRLTSPSPVHAFQGASRCYLVRFKKLCCTTPLKATINECFNMSSGTLIHKIFLWHLIQKVHIYEHIHFTYASSERQ